MKILLLMGKKRWQPGTGKEAKDPGKAVEAGQTHALAEQSRKRRRRRTK